MEPEPVCACGHAEGAHLDGLGGCELCPCDSWDPDWEASGDAR